MNIDEILDYTSFTIDREPISLSTKQCVQPAPAASAPRPALGDATAGPKAINGLVLYMTAVWNAGRATLCVRTRPSPDGGTPVVALVCLTA